MIYFTGDIHGNPMKIKFFCREHNLSSDDVIVILGDVGANYFGDKRDLFIKQCLSGLAPTIFCIHGNHEQRPYNIENYRLISWNGGSVWIQDRFPNLLFAKDGEIFNLDGIRYLVIGGAYSVDKFYRLRNGYEWWEDEQPSEETKRYVEKQITENSFDVILSHTCPYKYEPRECFLPHVNQSTVDCSTEKWLDEIEEKCDYKAWLCGHWHIDKRIDKIHFLFDTFESDEKLQYLCNGEKNV